MRARRVDSHGSDRQELLGLPAVIDCGHFDLKWIIVLALLIDAECQVKRHFLAGRSAALAAAVSQIEANVLRLKHVI